MQNKTAAIPNPSAISSPPTNLPSRTLSLEGKITVFAHLLRRLIVSGEKANSAPNNDVKTEKKKRMALGNTNFALAIAKEGTT